LRKARFRSKQQFERRFKKKLQKEEYTKGELVLVRNVGIEMAVSSRRKTDDRYFGPYEVARKNKGGAYILQELEGTLFRNNPTAAFRLLPYITRNHWFMQDNWTDEDDSDSEDGDEAFESSDND
jgi:hypothetical protein